MNNFYYGNNKKENKIFYLKLINKVLKSLGIMKIINFFMDQKKIW